MKHLVLFFILCFVIILSQDILAQTVNEGYAESAVFSETHVALPEDVYPVLGAWFWSQEEFLPEGYKTFIDQVVKHSCYNVLTTDIRLPGRDITDIDVYKQVKLATEYAKEKGIRIVLSMDPRTARRKFEEAYPDELQESLWLKEVDLSTDKPVDAVIKSIHLRDHMNGRKTPYISFEGSLLRVYSYNKTEEGADPATLSDITGLCSVISLCDDSILVRIPEKETVGQQHACIMVSYKHLTPDVFAPHLIEFTRQIIRNYSDIPLAGGMRDEWGFPPSTPADSEA